MSDHPPTSVSARDAALADLGRSISAWAQATVDAEGATATALRTDKFVYVGATGLAAPYLGRIFALDETFTGEVLATGKSKIFSTESAAKTSQTRAQSHRITSGIVVAAIFGGRPMGTVGVVTSRPDWRFVAQDIEQLEALGRLWAKGIAFIDSHRWQAPMPRLAKAEGPRQNAARQELNQIIQTLEGDGSAALKSRLLEVAGLLRKASE